MKIISSRLVRTVIFFLIGIILIFGLISFCFYFKYHAKIFPGVVIEGIDLSGKGKKDAIKIIDSFMQEKLNKQFMLHYKDNEWKFSFLELGVSPKIEEAVEEAYNVGRRKNFVDRIKSLWEALYYGYEIDLNYEFIESRAWQEIKGAIDIPPQDACYKIYWNNTVEIIPEELGITVNELLLKKEIIFGIRKEKNFCEIPVSTVLPRITTTDIREMKITGLLAEYSTVFNVGNVNRSHNIKLAAEKLDGVEIPPGGIFSFNEIVGARTKERGFREANIIVNNKFEKGIGGGVCQVSSTLYNSVLKAGLSILERKGHSLKIDYVPPGQDATVVYGYIDFKFSNNTNGYVVIKSRVAGGRLTIKLFGHCEESS